MPLNGQQMRVALMEKTLQLAATGGGYDLQQTQVLINVAQELGIRTPQHKAAQEALLTVWHDLFREGYLAWGVDIDNLNPPFCHLTDRGRTFLAHLSHDPANPQGYMRYLTTQITLNPVAQSYIEEALNTYNNMCYKATAVMVGAAAERMGLDVRDTLVSHLQAIGFWSSFSQGRREALRAWKISVVLSAIDKELHSYETEMGPALWERFASLWPAFTSQIRMTRNEAGHPTSINPVSPESAHSVLLIFPHQARLASDLITWIPSGIVSGH